MHTKFNKITTYLHDLSRQFTNAKKSQYNFILFCESQDVEVTTISKPKDLFVYSLDCLLRSFIAYE